MAVKMEILDNGLVRTYSDEGYKIQNLYTGQIYIDAIDPIHIHRTYVETDILISDDEVESEEGEITE